jgi:hypothetical protein
VGIPGGCDGLALIQAGTNGERLLEAVGPQRFAQFRHRLVLTPPQHRPRHPAGLAHTYLVTSEVARSLILVTPGSGAMEQFFRQAGEPVPELVLPEAGPLDIDRIVAAAERTGAVEILGGLHRSTRPPSELLFAR